MSTETKTIKYTFKQGVNRESTQYAAENGWYDCNRVRFRDQKPENIGGWSKRSSTSFDGTARDIHTWTDLSSKNYIGIATEQKILIFYGGQFYDVTPIQASATNATGNTTSGSTRIVVTATTHGLVTGRKTWVEFTSQTGAIGTNVSLAGNSYFVSVIDVNSFTFEYVSTADATAASAGAFGIDFLLQTGTSATSFGYGYGAGTYGRGTWNSAVASSEGGVGINMRQYTLDNFGEDLIIDYSPQGKLYQWDASNGLTTRAILVSASPTVTDMSIISPVDRHALCFGCNDLAGNFDPLLVRWSNQEDIENWTPSVSSTAGSVRLAGGSEIQSATRYRNLILVHTDTALHGLEYVGQPYIFTTRQLGENCGSIARHAVVDMNGVSYWMGNGQFYSYDGAIKVLDCTVLRYVFDDFNFDQQGKVYAGVNSEFSEITWLYCSRTATECDRYVTYNPVSNYWVFGESMWTAWADKGLFTSMLTPGVSSTTSYLWNNEPDGVYSGDGSTIESFIESGEFDLGDGDEILFVDRVIPDFVVDNGSIEFTIKSKEYPAGSFPASAIKGPFNVESDTQYVYTRSRGRQSVIRIAGASNDVKWKFGTIRMDVAGDGKR